MKSNTTIQSKNFFRRHWFIILSGVFCIALDQILKHFARTYPSVTHYLVPHIIGWEYFENTGIAFSIPIPQFIIIPMTIVIIIIGGIMVKKEQKNKVHLLGAGLIIAGALSNLTDRMLYGITIDYIRVFTSIFNIADLAIILGGILVLKKNKNYSNLSN